MASQGESFLARRALTSSPAGKTVAVSAGFADSGWEEEEASHEVTVSTSLAGVTAAGCAGLGAGRAASFFEIETWETRSTDCRIIGFAAEALGTGTKLADSIVSQGVASGADLARRRIGAS